MSYAQFPKINLTQLQSQLTEDEQKYIPYVFNKSGELRRSKVKFNPKAKTGETYTTTIGNVFNIWRYTTDIDRTKAESAYIWRMVAFYCVNSHPYNCRPETADFWIDGTDVERNEKIKSLDSIVDKILILVGHQNWHSANRWRNALGY